MRLHFEGKDTPIVPHLLGRMAERLAQLNTPHEDICEARVTLVQCEGWHEARVRLLLAEKTLHAMQHGASPDAAIGAALRKIENALHKVRAARFRRRTVGFQAPGRREPYEPFLSLHTLATVLQKK